MNSFFRTAGKGFWSEMLGVGDFYYELGVQIIEVCLALKHRNGGKFCRFIVLKDNAFIVFHINKTGLYWC